MHVLARPLLAAALLAAAGAGAQTSFAERSQHTVDGQQIRLFGLPTTDANGKVKYYDVTVSLTIGANGRPASSAAVETAPSPKVKATEFLPGAYVALSDGVPCTLVNSPFSGRVQYDLRCTRSDGDLITMTWYNGPIAGHPLEALLVNAGLDTLPGNEEYSWGRVTFTNAGSQFGCLTTFGHLFGARQVGDLLTLSNYVDNVSLNCTRDFQRTP